MSTKCVSIIQGRLNLFSWVLTNIGLIPGTVKWHWVQCLAKLVGSVSKESKVGPNFGGELIFNSSSDSFKNANLRNESESKMKDSLRRGSH